MAMLGELLNLQQQKGIIPGVARGTVKENWNDKYPGMVKVEMFLGEQGKCLTGWAPVMARYAGNDYGAYCLPEVGQAVVIAFELGEKSCPIVIGALWDKKNVLPKETANGNNTVKRFRTKGGCEIVCKEEQGKEQIIVQTPAKLTISLEDEKKLICLKDENAENALTMDCEKGIFTFSAKKKIIFKIDSEEAAAVDSSSVKFTRQDIKNEAKGTFSADAQNVKMAAKANINMAGKAGVEVKAGSSMKLYADGVLEENASMLKFN